MRLLERALSEAWCFVCTFLRDRLPTIRHRRRSAAGQWWSGGRHAVHASAHGRLERAGSCSRHIPKHGLQVRCACCLLSMLLTHNRSFSSKIRHPTTLFRRAARLSRRLTVARMQSCVHACLCSGQSVRPAVEGRPSAHDRHAYHLRVGGTRVRGAGGRHPQLGIGRYEHRWRSLYLTCALASSRVDVANHALQEVLPDLLCRLPR